MTSKPLPTPVPLDDTTVLHEGVRQSYLKACELSLASGLLGDGDRSDLLELYKSLWPNAPSDIREKALMQSIELTPKLECNGNCFRVGGTFIAEDPACPLHGSSENNT